MLAAAAEFIPEVIEDVGEVFSEEVFSGEASSIGQKIPDSTSAPPAKIKGLDKYYNSRNDIRNLKNVVKQYSTPEEQSTAINELNNRFGLKQKTNILRREFSIPDELHNSNVDIDFKPIEDLTNLNDVSLNEISMVGNTGLDSAEEQAGYLEKLKQDYNLNEANFNRIKSKLDRYDEAVEPKFNKNVERAVDYIKKGEQSENKFFISGIRNLKEINRALDPAEDEAIYNEYKDIFQDLVNKPKKLGKLIDDYSNLSPEEVEKLKRSIDMGSKRIKTKPVPRYIYDRLKTEPEIMKRIRIMKSAEEDEIIEPAVESASAPAEPEPAPVESAPAESKTYTGKGKEPDEIIESDEEIPRQKKLVKIKKLKDYLNEEELDFIKNKKQLEPVPENILNKVREMSRENPEAFKEYQEFINTESTFDRFKKLYADIKNRDYSGVKEAANNLFTMGVIPGAGFYGVSELLNKLTSKGGAPPSQLKDIIDTMENIYNTYERYNKIKKEKENLRLQYNTPSFNRYDNQVVTNNYEQSKIQEQYLEKQLNQQKEAFNSMVEKTKRQMIVDETNRIREESNKNIQDDKRNFLTPIRISIKPNMINNQSN